MILFLDTVWGGYIFNPIKGGNSEYRNRFRKFLTGNQVLYVSVKHLKDKLIIRRCEKIKKALHRELNDNDILFNFDKEFKMQSDVIYAPIIRGNSRERVGFPTQKPLALLNPIIAASSNMDDMVLDPFCGCATACIAAEKLGRQWVGIDISPKAAELVALRMRRELGMFYRGAHLQDDAIERTDIVPILKYNSKENKETLYGKQKGFCNGCREHFKDRHLEIDHIVPSSHGGGDHIENLQLLCGSCNRIKGNRPMEYLMSRLQHSSLMTFAAG